MAKNDWIGHADRKGAHYSANWGPEKQKEYMKNYYRTHPEKWRAMEQAGRAEDAATHKAAKNKQEFDTTAQNQFSLIDGAYADTKTPAQKKRQERMSDASDRNDEKWFKNAADWHKNLRSASDAADRLDTARNQVTKDAHSLKGIVSTNHRTAKANANKAAKKLDKKLSVANKAIGKANSNARNKINTATKPIRTAADKAVKSYNNAINGSYNNITSGVKKQVKADKNDLVARGGDIVNNIVGSFSKKKGKKKK